jgi:hypothetical protein
MLHQRIQNTRDLSRAHRLADWLMNNRFCQERKSYSAQLVETGINILGRLTNYSSLVRPCSAGMN